MKRTIGLLLTAVVGCGGGSSTSNGDMTVGPMPDMTAGPGDMATGPGDMAVAPNAARGEYLVKAILVCGDCHTTPDQMGQPSMDPTKFLAGGRTFPIPGLGPDGGVLVITVPNLTPDNATGIGMMTLDEIKTAITKGLDEKMRPLIHIMPYYQYGLLNDTDVTSLALFLKSLPPQTNQLPENPKVLPFPAPLLDDSKIPHTTLAPADPNYAAAERGRYIAKTVCIECHTKHNDVPFPSVLMLDKAFAGGEVFPLAPNLITISANITSDQQSGIGKWTIDEIANTLKTDLEKGTGRHLCPPMPGGMGRFGNMTDGDRTDIATFVHTLPAIHAGPFGCDDAGVPYGFDGGP